MEKVVNALLKSIRDLGIEAVLMPQTANATRPKIELYFAGIEPAGIDGKNSETGNLGWERITFNALFCGEGTHSKWVNDVIIASRKLLPLQEKHMQLIFRNDIGEDVKLTAHWRRLSPGRFEYPDKEESSMPVKYVEQWEITVAYPAHIITD